MGPYQRTPKEFARAIRYSGWGVRSVGPVGDFLDLEFSCLFVVAMTFVHPLMWCSSIVTPGTFWWEAFVYKTSQGKFGVCKFLMAEWVKVEVSKFIVNDKLYTYICDIYKFYRFSLQDSYIWHNIYDFSKFFASLGLYKSSAWWS